MSRNFVIGAVSLTASVWLAVSAAAAPRVDVYGEDGRISETVKYSEHDLRTAEGAKALAFRIRVAAARVCGGDQPLVRARTGFGRCLTGAIDRAVAGLDAPLVADALGRTAPTAMAHR